MIYIASPYSDDDIEVMTARAEKAAQCVANLMLMGKNCFSPIVHGHAIQNHLSEKLRRDHRFWVRHNFEMIMLASELHVLRLDGWEKSLGVAFEVKLAEALRIDISFIEEV